MPNSKKTNKCSVFSHNADEAYGEAFRNAVRIKSDCCRSGVPVKDFKGKPCFGFLTGISMIQNFALNEKKKFVLTDEIE